MAYPDPQAALAAYGAPDMAITPQDIAAYDQQQANGAFVDQLMAQPTPMQTMQLPMGPDPRLALQAYTGRNAAQLQQQDLQGMVGAMGEQQAAERQLGHVRADTANRQADAMASQGVDQAMAAESMQMGVEENQAAQQKLLDEKRQVDEFIGSYEPRDRRTQQQRVMGALAMALGGFGDAVAARGGAPQQHNLDRVIGIINTGIDRDLDAQREMIANKKTQSQGLDTELGHMQRMYGQTQQANEMARVMKLQQAQQELQAIAASGAAEEAKVTAAGAAAKIGQQIEETKFRVDSARLQEERAKAAAAARGGAKGPDYGSMTPAQLQALSDAGVLSADGTKVLKGLKGESAGGTAQDIPGYRRTKDVPPATLTEANKIAASSTGLNSSLDQLAQLRDAYSQTSVVDVGKRSQLAAQARQIIGNYADTASQLAGGGQAGEAAKKQAMEDIPDPTQWDLPGRADPKSVYTGLKQQNKAAADAKMRSMGYEPEGGASGLPPDVQAKMDALGIKKKVR